MANYNAIEQLVGAQVLISVSESTGLPDLIERLEAGQRQASRACLCDSNRQIRASMQRARHVGDSTKRQPGLVYHSGVAYCVRGPQHVSRSPASITAYQSRRIISDQVDSILPLVGLPERPARAEQQPANRARTI